MAMSKPFKWPEGVHPSDRLWQVPALANMMRDDAKECNRRAVKQWGGQNYVAGIHAKHPGLLGGRPPKKQQDMPKKARVIKRCIDREMTIREIGELLDQTHQSISDYIRRYNLRG